MSHKSLEKEIKRLQGGPESGPMQILLQEQKSGLVLLVKKFIQNSERKKTHDWEEDTRAVTYTQTLIVAWEEYSRL